MLKKNSSSDNVKFLLKEISILKTESWRILETFQKGQKRLIKTLFLAFRTKMTFIIHEIVYVFQEKDEQIRSLDTQYNMKKLI